MNIMNLWQCLLGLPALMFPGLSFMPGQAAPAPTPMRTEAPVSKAKPSPPATATAKPVAKPTPTPKPVAAAPASAEIASEQACPGQGDVAKTAAALVCLTTNARAYHGLGAVSSNPALMAAAAAKAQDMLSCGYGHTACGHEFNYWMQQKGYTGRCTAENIAMGQQSPREVFGAWMNSAGHRANILNGDYRDIGVAEIASSKGPQWVMELGGC